MKKILVLLISVIFLSACTSKKETANPAINPSPSTTPEQTLPISEFKARITKKKFGTYITPQNSPVSPERFTGYHTGVDVEYGDVDTDVPVFTIDDGHVISSGTVNGYGGFVAIHHQNTISTYGHLRPSSLVKNNTNVKKGDQIGVLGTGFTSETDNERKHLHFSIINGTKLDLRGYVSTSSSLSLWQNPLD